MHSTTHTCFTLSFPRRARERITDRPTISLACKFSRMCVWYSCGCFWFERACVHAHISEVKELCHAYHQRTHKSTYGLHYSAASCGEIAHRNKASRA